MKKEKRWIVCRAILWVALLSCLAAGCGSGSAADYGYRPPEQIDDGFAVGTPDDVNLDAALLTEAVAGIENGRYGEIHAMLILKDR